MNKQQIKETIKNYHWLVIQLKKNQQNMNEDIRVSVTAQGGIESSMPKGKGQTSDSVSNEVIRRDTEYKWLDSINDKVTYIQERIHVVNNPDHAKVLSMLLGGVNISNVAKKTRLSRQTIYNIQDEITDKFYNF